MEEMVWLNIVIIYEPEILGRLGHGSDLSVFSPMKISALEPYIVNHIACGGMHSICVTSIPTGWVLTWGLGTSGNYGCCDRIINDGFQVNWDTTAI